MPGTFSKSARPLRPGAYFDWVATQQETVLPNIGSIVAVPTTHDWGPANRAVLTTSFADFQAQFGPSTNTPAYKAVKQAYVGEGLPGRGGAGGVLVYRMVGSGGAAATVTINNTTPAPALTITARYPGLYGQNLTLNKQVNALDNTKNDFVISLNGTPVETYTYTPGQIATLAAAINASSQWVIATSLINGVALGAVSNVPLAGGNNGGTLTGTDFTGMENVLGTQRFSVFALDDVAATASWSDSTGDAIFAALLAWQASLNANGKRFMTVIGGSLADTAATAVARSALANDPNVVNLGVGSVVDSELGALSTSQLAPRVAGILAQRGEDRSITFARLANTTAVGFATDSGILQAFNGGVVVLSLDSNPDAPVRLEKGLTTYIGGDATRPYLIYRNPKFVRTMHGIELELSDWAATNAIGELQVNDTSRAYIVGHVKESLDARVRRGVIQPNPSVAIDPNPPPSDLDEFIALVYGIAFGRSVEQVYETVYIS